MTTYTDEVNIYNPDAIASAIDDAGAANAMVTAVGTDGVKVHPAGQSEGSGSGIVDYALIDADGMEVFQNGDSVASFGSTARVGSETGPRTVIQSSGVDFYGASDGSVNLAHIGYASGNSNSGTSIRPYYTLGTRRTATAQYSTSSTYQVGDHVLYNGVEYVCIIAITSPGAWNASRWAIPIGNYSMVEGSENTANGFCAHAEGYATVAVGGWSSHAEGYGSKACCPLVQNDFTSRTCHAEGYYTTASGPSSHSEGIGTLASESGSHAEGLYSKATGYGTHAQNIGTVAGYYCQTAIGEYNNKSTNLFEIGNGTSDSARSNAFEVSNTGKITSPFYAGFIQMYGGSTAPDGWLVCDGSAVSRTTYAALFSAIGTTWGAGDGSTTFNLPDLRGRAPIGAGTGSGLTARTLGQTLGSQNIQAHTHSITSVLESSGVAIASSRVGTVSSGGITYALRKTNNAIAGVTATGAVSSGTSTGSAGNMQPSAVVNFIICTGL